MVLFLSSSFQFVTLPVENLSLDRKSVRRATLDSFESYISQIVETKHLGKFAVSG